MKRQIRPILVPEWLKDELRGARGMKASFTLDAVNNVVPDLDKRLYYETLRSLERPFKAQVTVDTGAVSKILADKRKELTEQGLKVPVTMLIRVAMVIHAREIFCREAKNAL